MEVEFDPAKDAENIARRGISLALAAELFEGPTLEAIDERRDYGEARIIAYGLIAGRLHVCVYTERGNRRRIISLRRANAREQKKFADRQV